MGIRKTILLVLPFILVAVCLLSFLLFSRFSYQSGVDRIARQEFTAGIDAFEKALSLLKWPATLTPQPFFANDLQRLHRAWGELYFKKGAHANTLKNFHMDMEKSLEQYRLAVNLNPYDIEAATGFARSTAALEKLPLRFTSRKKYDALPLFEHALLLRPQGLEVHFHYIRYLHWKNLNDTLLQTAAKLVQFHPQTFHLLKKEPYYTVQLEEALLLGLQGAVSHPPSRQEAYLSLSVIEEGRGNFDQTLLYYQKYLEDLSSKAKASHYTRLGGLLLKTGKPALAVEAFAVALQVETDRERILNQIWSICRVEKQYAVFLQFLEKHQAGIETGGGIEVLKAKCLIELEQYSLAKFHLLKIPKDSRYLAEGSALQARIAEKSQDWDEMELSSHQATVLDPKNSGYHLLFSTALKHKKKLLQAEAAAGSAIETSAAKAPWLYNHRAWIRWENNNVTGAAQDWEEAIRLKPEEAVYHYYLALAHERLKNPGAALKALEKAVSLNPDDAKYIEKLNLFKKKAAL